MAKILYTEILLYNINDQEIMNKKTETWVSFVIDMNEIESCRLANHDDQEGLDFGKTMIYTKSGQTFIINMYLEKFVKLKYGIDITKSQPNFDI